MRFPRATLVAVLAAFVAVLAPTAVSAHTESSYFTQGKYNDNATINWGLNTGFPTGAFRTAVYDAALQWRNNGSGNESNAYWGLPDDVSYGSFTDPCGIPDTNNVAMWYLDLDAYAGTAAAGATLLCHSGSLIFTSAMGFDSDRTWYAGTGDAPSNAYDFWSVASHEWGHALGFYEHIAESDSACPDDSTRATMCPTVYIGTERQRTLATHDIHTFDAAY